VSEEKALSQYPGGNPPVAVEDGYAKAAKGALVFVLGRGGASGVITYTGEPSIEGFESKLRRLHRHRGSL